MLVINDMIDFAEGKQKEILYELKRLNKKAYRLMLLPRRSWKVKYHLVQKSAYWFRAKELLIDFFTYDDIFRCNVCGKVMNYKQCVMHHKEYRPEELFTPKFIRFLHSHCHGSIHS